MKKIQLMGPINVNCYILEDQGQCYIIDPGYEKNRLIEYVRKHKLQVLGILLTHSHFDHIGALDAFPVPVYLHQEELQQLELTYQRGFAKWNLPIPYNPKTIKFVPFDDTTIFRLGEQQISVIYTPGHTLGGVCYKYQNELYTGDTLFLEEVGFATHKTFPLLKHSIVSLINNQEEELMVYPGHGSSTSIRHEKNANPYYLEWKTLF